MADRGFASAASTATVDQLLRLEDHAGYGDRFIQVDRLAADLLGAALNGHKIATIAPGPRREKYRDTLALGPLREPSQAFLDNTFRLAAQQARGAWFLPERATLKLTQANLPAYMRRYPAHALTIAREDTAEVGLSSNADTLAAWALIIPLFDTLMAPITERAAGSVKPPHEQAAAWEAIAATYHQLGIAAEPEFSVFVYQGGWASLDRADHARARIALLDALARQDHRQIAARTRAMRVQPLVAALMKKSRNGTPLARQVLTKQLQPVLAAYFGGDWLALLDYVGMPANSNEEIITALPKPKLYVAGAVNADAIAAQHGIGVDDVRAMLAAFMGQNISESPIEQRLTVLNRWWTEFDTIHARQTPGMTPLWGLVEESDYYPAAAQSEVPGPTPQLYRQLLAADLVDDINRLWRGVTLRRWPQTIVSEPYPHRLMAETLGPAAAFWHGVALTAWYVCEGPYSRTSLSGLRDYHEQHLTALSSAGTPIHPSLFDELSHAESRLGPPQNLHTDTDRTRIGGGVEISISYGWGQRRDGFEILRDIITRHRRGWSQRSLREYVDHRWNTELTGAAHELHRAIAAKGKTPTLRQFTSHAIPAVNHWFNGDMSILYTTLGEKAPTPQRCVRLLPDAGAHEFIDKVYAALGGQFVDEKLREISPSTYARMWELSKLAMASTRYLQMREALGRPPTSKEFSADRYQWSWSGGLDEGWTTYQFAISRLIH